jgi:membrane-bound lytic murein transglycosylase D
MKNPLPLRLIFKHMKSLWTLDSADLSLSKGGLWTRFGPTKMKGALKALVSGTVCAVVLPFTLSAFLPESPPSAAAVGMKPEEKLVTVDKDLILEPGGGITAKGPLIERALSLASTDEVRGQLDYLLSNKREEIRRSLSLSTRYLPHINPILKEYGLPQELAFLCIIESGYNLSARSHAGAVGMWQMIRATSRRFDLVTDTWVDDRLDFVKSTEGAARFFLYLKERFESWDHILAAYNAGEGRVGKAIRKARRQNLVPEFRNLALPRETRIYVPAFYASLLIALEPERYGIFPDYQPPLDFFEIKIPGGVPLSTVSQHIGCDLEDLRYLNPSILKDRIPFREGGFAMRVPCWVQQDQAMIVAANLNEVQYVSYRVRRGDTIWDISRKFGVSMSRITRAGQNRGNLSKIFPGEILLVALTGGAG